MKIIISNNAHRDIQEIYNYISYDSLYFAEYTVTKIYNYINKLEFSPYLGRYIPELPDKQYRELIYKSYRIIYSISERTNEVRVYFVFHSKRNFKILFDLYRTEDFNF